ncbi:MAG: hypothetical protein HY721_25300 [Planctomycetes bacterium]|nr:hypothetical protein [Planctomycetota bacterium]
MSALRKCCLGLVFGALTLAPVAAELPLPDATIYGQIKSKDGAPVKTGALSARVERGGAAVLQAPGIFVSADGADWYVIRIPLETNIGAPGPTGLAAREADVVAALTLNGSPLELGAPLGALKAGSVTRIDATAAVSGLRYIRGDCSPDRVVNISDAVSVLGYLFLGTATPACLEACDGDGTGVLNISDAVYILGFLFLGGPAPPPPGPGCGTDDSPSDLGCVTSSCA